MNNYKDYVRLQKLLSKITWKLMAVISGRHSGKRDCQFRSYGPCTSTSSTRALFRLSIEEIIFMFREQCKTALGLGAERVIFTSLVDQEFDSKKVEMGVIGRKAAEINHTKNVWGRRCFLVNLSLSLLRSKPPTSCSSNINISKTYPPPLDSIVQPVSLTLAYIFSFSWEGPSSC